MSGMKNRKRASFAGSIGTIVSTAWLILTTAISAANLPSDANDAWKAIVSTSPFLPAGLAALCVVTLVWAIWWPVSAVAPEDASNHRPTVPPQAAEGARFHTDGSVYAGSGGSGQFFGGGGGGGGGLEIGADGSVRAGGGGGGGGVTPGGAGGGDLGGGGGGASGIPAHIANQPYWQAGWFISQPTDRFKVSHGAMPSDEFVNQELEKAGYRFKYSKSSVGYTLEER
ncbi:hypothetical protein [Sphingomonas sp. Leaf20]|uniref:hypothetical protein n=1 Tax=Sphingomonas sp. Leaf20 TaxID=1735685 RepID=UPI000AC10905|nr:hypothetical protein [Sphingomonas sp. Leaf20]